MTDHTKKEIEDRIKDVRKHWKKATETKQKSLSNNIDGLKQAWKPLTDYLDMLAEMKLPPEKKFGYAFVQEDNGHPQFIVYFSKDDPKNTNMEIPLGKNTIYFLNLKPETLSLTCAFSGNHIKSHEDNWEFFPDKPENIEHLKKELTEWFINTVGNDFDPDKITPVVIEQTTIRRPEL